MSSSRPSEAPMSEPLPCPDCGAARLVRSVETCRLADGLAVKRLRHFRCRACGARFFDDQAMGRIKAERAKACLAHTG